MCHLPEKLVTNRDQYKNSLSNRLKDAAVPVSLHFLQPFMRRKWGSHNTNYIMINLCYVMI